MPKTRPQKEEMVQQLKDKLARAKSVVFADFKGITMNQLSDLRDKLRHQQAEFSITKNTLLKLALDEKRLTIKDKRLLDGPTATLMAFDDEISPIKILVKALKDFGLGKIKAGFLGVEPLDETRLQQLASLPTKDELKLQTVGVLAAPLQGMVNVLHGNLRNLVYALDRIRLQRGGV